MSEERPAEKAEGTAGAESVPARVEAKRLAGRSPHPAEAPGAGGENGTASACEAQAARPGREDRSPRPAAVGEEGTVAKPRGRYWVALDLLLVVCCFFIGQFIGVFLGLAAQKMWGISQEAFYFVAYASGMVLAVGGGFLVRGLGGGSKLPKRTFRIGTPHSSLVLWGIVACVAMSVAVEPLVDLMPLAKYHQMLANLGLGTWAILSTVLAAPVLEELIFRGIIQEEAMRRWGGFWGILIGAVIFAAVHLIPPQMVGAFFAALVIGYVYMRTRSLLAVMVIHAVNNILAYLQMSISNDTAATVRDLVGNAGWYWSLYAASVAFIAISAMTIAGGHIHRMWKFRLKRTQNDEPQR